MQRESLDLIPLWGLGLAAFMVAWCALEGGFRLGRWRHARAMHLFATTTAEQVLELGKLAAVVEVR